MDSDALAQKKKTRSQALVIMIEIIDASEFTMTVQKPEPHLTGRFFRTAYLAPDVGEEQQFLVTLESSKRNGIASDFNKATASVRNRDELILQIEKGITGELPVVAFRKDSPKKLTFIVYCHPSAVSL